MKQRKESKERQGISTASNDAESLVKTQNENAHWIWKHTVYHILSI